MHFLIESWLDSLERLNVESHICLVEYKLYRIGILWYVFFLLRTGIFEFESVWYFYITKQ